MAKRRQACKLSCASARYEAINGCQFTDMKQMKKVMWKVHLDRPCLYDRVKSVDWGLVLVLVHPDIVCATLFYSLTWFKECTTLSDFSRVHCRVGGTCAFPFANAQQSLFFCLCDRFLFPFVYWPRVNSRDRRSLSQYQGRSQWFFCLDYLAYCEQVRSIL